MLKSASVTAEDTPEDVFDWRLVPSYVPIAERSLPGATARLAMARKEAEWQLSPLRIPDRDADEWDDTHPLEQIKWTWAKNAACNGHYVNVVKAFKWYRRINYTTPKYPKGYPVEHLIGQCCPDGITSVAEGVTLTLEAITANYRSYARAEQAPVLSFMLKPARGRKSPGAPSTLRRCARAPKSGASCSAISSRKRRRKVATVGTARRRVTGTPRGASRRLWAEAATHKCAL
jgi:hypothetical protein